MIGLLGGTFDPPHIGHLILAIEAADRFELEKVLLIPARIPPHKDNAGVSPFEHRFAMTKLAVQDDSMLEAADLEEPEGNSYTVDLLLKLTSKGEKYCFIIGMDSLADIHNWRKPEEILELSRVVAGTRPGFNPEAVEVKFRDRVDLFDIPEIGISSSELRKRVANGGVIKYYVTGDVISYIKENNLYVR